MRKKRNKKLEITAELMHCLAALQWGYKRKSMIKSEWRYPEGAPQFDQAGEFIAWLAGSGGPEKSAAAWRVEAKEIPGLFIETVKSSDLHSTSPRAALAGLAGALEALQPGSTLAAFTRSEYVQTAANNILSWKAQDWEGSDGPLANCDILRRVERVLRERAIRLWVYHVPKGYSPHDETIERLTKRARAARRDAA